MIHIDQSILYVPLTTSKEFIGCIGVTLVSSSQIVSSFTSSLSTYCVVPIELISTQAPVVLPNKAHMLKKQSNACGISVKSETSCVGNLFPVSLKRDDCEMKSVSMRKMIQHLVSRSFPKHPCYIALFRLSSYKIYIDTLSFMQDLFIDNDPTPLFHVGSIYRQ